MTDRTTEEARKAFIAVANDRGYDTAHAYDTDRCRWVFFNPMTTDLWAFWQAALKWQAGQQKGEADPLDMPLPCDITVGHVTMSKGVSLRSLVFRMRALYELAQEAASPHGVPPLPSCIQQRAIDLHQKAAMPWPDAEELALNEAGIDARAIDELIGECGYAGLASMLCTDDELRRFTRSVLVHQPASSLPQAPQGEQWISVHERLPELPVDNEDDGVKVYTWDGEFVTEDEFVPEWEQPAGPAVGGWLRTGEWFASDTASRVTHWMPRHLPAPPPLAQGDSQ